MTVVQATGLLSEIGDRWQLLIDVGLVVVFGGIHVAAWASECWTALNRAATRRWLRGDATREATQELIASTLEHVLRTFGAPPPPSRRTSSP